MQNFSKETHKKFIKHFDIKKNPSEIDLSFLEKTKKYLNLIKWIPGIKMIGVGNSISMNAGKESSDIDLFIITSVNRIWIVRILITRVFQFLGVRKTSSKHAGRFCLSFFITEKSKDFSPFALENDIYLFFRIVYFKPILNFDNTYENFIEANKNWADLDNYFEIIDQNKNNIKITGKSFGNNSKILDLIEKILKKIFLPRTIKNYENLGKPFGIIINDDILKFHDKDIRKKILDDFSYISNK